MALAAVPQGRACDSSPAFADPASLSGLIRPLPRGAEVDPYLSNLLEEELRLNELIGLLDTADDVLSLDGPTVALTSLLEHLAGVAGLEDGPLQDLSAAVRAYVKKTSDVQQAAASMYRWAERESDLPPDEAGRFHRDIASRLLEQLALTVLAEGRSRATLDDEERRASAAAAAVSLRAVMKSGDVESLCGEAGRLGRPLQRLCDRREAPTIELAEEVVEAHEAVVANAFVARIGADHETHTSEPIQQALRERWKAFTKARPGKDGERPAALVAAFVADFEAQATSLQAALDKLRPVGAGPTATDELPVAELRALLRQTRGSASIAQIAAMKLMAPAHPSDVVRERLASFPADSPTRTLAEALGLATEAATGDRGSVRKRLARARDLHRDVRRMILGATGVDPEHHRPHRALQLRLVSLAPAPGGFTVHVTVDIVDHDFADEPPAVAKRGAEDEKRLPLRTVTPTGIDSESLFIPWSHETGAFAQALLDAWPDLVAGAADLGRFASRFAIPPLPAESLVLRRSGSLEATVFGECFALDLGVSAARSNARCADLDPRNPMAKLEPLARARLHEKASEVVELLLAQLPLALSVSQRDKLLAVVESAGVKLEAGVLRAAIPLGEIRPGWAGSYAEVELPAGGLPKVLLTNVERLAVDALVSANPWLVFKAVPDNPTLREVAVVRANEELFSLGTAKLSKDGVAFTPSPMSRSVPIGGGFSLDVREVAWRRSDHAVELRRVKLLGPPPFEDVANLLIRIPARDEVLFELATESSPAVCASVESGLQTLGVLPDGVRVVGVEVAPDGLRPVFDPPLDDVLATLIGVVDAELTRRILASSAAIRARLVSAGRHVGGTVDARLDELEAAVRDQELVPAHRIDIPPGGELSSECEDLLWGWRPFTCSIQLHLPQIGLDDARLTLVADGSRVRYQLDDTIERWMRRRIEALLPSLTKEELTLQVRRHPARVVGRTRVPVGAGRAWVAMEVGLDGRITPDLAEYQKALSDLARREAKRALADARVNAAEIERKLHEAVESAARHAGLGYERRSCTRSGRRLTCDLSLQLGGSTLTLRRVSVGLDRPGLDFSEVVLDANEVNRWLTDALRGRPLKLALSEIIHRRDGRALELVVDATLELPDIGSPLRTSLRIGVGDGVTKVDLDRALVELLRDALRSQVLPWQWGSPSAVRLVSVDADRDDLLLRGAVHLAHEPIAIELPLTIRFPVAKPGAPSLEVVRAALIEELANSILRHVEVPAGKFTFYGFRLRTDSGHEMLDDDRLHLPSALVFRVKVAVWTGAVEFEVLVDRSGIRLLDDHLAITFPPIHIEPFVIDEPRVVIDRDRVRINGKLTMGEAEASHVVHAFGEHSIDPRRPRGLDSDSELKLFDHFSLGKARKSIDLDKPSLTQSIEVGGAVSRIIHGKGTATLRLNSERAAELTGVLEAESRILKARLLEGALNVQTGTASLSVDGKANLKLFTTDFSFSTGEGFSNPRLTAFGRIPAGHFEIVGAKLTLTPQMARVEFRFMRAHVALTVPSLDDLSIDKILELILDGVTPTVEELIDALKQVLRGKIEINPFAGFGPGGGSLGRGGPRGGGGSPGNGGAPGSGGSPGNGGAPGSGGLPGNGEAPGNGSPPGQAGSRGSNVQTTNVGNIGDALASVGGPDLQRPVGELLPYGEVGAKKPMLLNKGDFQYTIRGSADTPDVFLHNAATNEEQKLGRVHLRFDDQVHFQPVPPTGGTFASVGKPLLAGQDYYVHAVNQGQGALYWFQGDKPSTARLDLARLGLSFDGITENATEPKRPAFKSFLSDVGTSDWPDGPDIFEDVRNLSYASAIAAHHRGESFYRVHMDEPSDGGARRFLIIDFDLGFRDEAFIVKTLTMMREQKHTVAKVYDVAGTLFVRVPDSLMKWEDGELIDLDERPEGKKWWLAQGHLRHPREGAQPAPEMTAAQQSSAFQAEVAAWAAKASVDRHQRSTTTAPLEEAAAVASGGADVSLFESTLFFVEFVSSDGLTIITRRVDNHAPILYARAEIDGRKMFTQRPDGSWAIANNKLVNFSDRLLQWVDGEGRCQVTVYGLTGTSTEAAGEHEVATGTLCLHDAHKDATAALANAVRSFARAFAGGAIRQLETVTATVAGIVVSSAEADGTVNARLHVGTSRATCVANLARSSDADDLNRETAEALLSMLAENDCPEFRVVKHEERRLVVTSHALFVLRDGHLDRAANFRADQWSEVVEVEPELAASLFDLIDSERDLVDLRLVVGLKFEHQLIYRTTHSGDTWLARRAGETPVTLGSTEPDNLALDDAFVLRWISAAEFAGEPGRIRSVDNEVFALVGKGLHLDQELGIDRERQLVRVTTFERPPADLVLDALVHELLLTRANGWAEDAIVVQQFNEPREGLAMRPREPSAEGGWRYIIQVDDTTRAVDVEARGWPRDATDELFKPRVIAGVATSSASTVALHRPCVEARGCLHLALEGDELATWPTGESRQLLGELTDELPHEQMRAMAQYIAERVLIRHEPAVFDDVSDPTPAGSVAVHFSRDTFDTWFVGGRRPAVVLARGLREVQPREKIDHLLALLPRSQDGVSDLHLVDARAFFALHRAAKAGIEVFAMDVEQREIRSLFSLPRDSPFLELMLGQLSRTKGNAVMDAFAFEVAEGGVEVAGIRVEGAPYHQVFIGTAEKHHTFALDSAGALPRVLEQPQVRALWREMAAAPSTADVDLIVTSRAMAAIRADELWAPGLAGSPVTPLGRGRWESRRTVTFASFIDDLVAEARASTGSSVQVTEGNCNVRGVFCARLAQERGVTRVYAGTRPVIRVRDLEGSEADPILVGAIAGYRDPINPSLLLRLIAGTSHRRLVVDGDVLLRAYEAGPVLRRLGVLPSAVDGLPGQLLEDLDARAASWPITAEGDFFEAVRLASDGVAVSAQASDIWQAYFSGGNFDIDGLRSVVGDDTFLADLASRANVYAGTMVSITTAGLPWRFLHRGDVVTVWSRRTRFGDTFPVRTAVRIEADGSDQTFAAMFGALDERGFRAFLAGGQRVDVELDDSVLTDDAFLRSFLTLAVTAPSVPELRLVDAAKFVAVHRAQSSTLYVWTGRDLRDIGPAPRSALDALWGDDLARRAFGSAAPRFANAEQPLLWAVGNAAWAVRDSATTAWVWSEGTTAVRACPTVRMSAGMAKYADDHPLTFERAGLGRCGAPYLKQCLDKVLSAAAVRPSTGARPLLPDSSYKWWLLCES